jgi:uncharacterized protein YcfJ
MLKLRTALGMALVSTALLAGCTEDPTTNAMIGALGGAAVGSQVGGGSGTTAAMLGGAAVGAAVGANAPTRRY